MIVTFTIKNLVFRIDHFKLSFSSFNFVLNLEILFSNTEVYIWYVEHMFRVSNPGFEEATPTSKTSKLNKNHNNDP